MKSLPIDRAFTLSYINSLIGFSSSVVSSCQAYDQTLYISMSQLKVSLRTASHQIKSGKNVSRKLEISGFMIPVANKLSSNDKNKLGIYVGGVIEIEDSVLINQSICFSMIYYVQQDMDEDMANLYNCYPYKEGAHILRKFHFDIDRSAKSDRPLSHLQYGGSFKPEHFSVCTESNEQIDYRLYSILDDPRLPAIPYGFATCLDIIFRAFNTKASVLSEEPWWKEKVVQSEKMWLIPFFKAAVDSMGQCGKETFYEFMTKKTES